MKAKWIYLAMGFGLLVGFSGTAQTQSAIDPINISNSNAACVFAFDCRPALATRNGEVFVAWAQEVGPNQSTLYFSKSTDAGNTFDDPKAIEISAAVQAQQPVLALDANDNLILAWADNRSGDFEILVSLSKDKGNTWTWDEDGDYINLSNNTGDSLEPSLTVAINGGVVIVAWSDDTSDEVLNPNGVRNIFLKASLNPALVQVQTGGIDLSDRVQTINVSKRFFSSLSLPAEHPQLAVSPGNLEDFVPDVFIVWQQRGILDEEIYFHEIVAFNPVSVSGSPNAASRRPVIAVRLLNDVLSRQQVVIAWVEQVGSDTRILSNSTTEAGLFLNPAGFSNTPLEVSGPSEMAVAPALAVNDQGEFFIVWEAQDFTSRNPSEIKLRSLSNAFSRIETLSERTDVLNRDAKNPVVVADDNNIYVAWVDKNRAANEADIFFVRRPILLFGP